MSQEGASVNSLESHKKGGLGGRFKGFGMSCCCPLLHWLRVLCGLLEFRRCTPEREEEGEGKAMGVLLEGECAGASVMRH